MTWQIPSQTKAGVGNAAHSCDYTDDGCNNNDKKKSNSLVFHQRERGRHDKAGDNELLPRIKCKEQAEANQADERSRIQE